MIGFRVDANETIATGHLMRCMAIAAACRKKGEKCLFIMAEEKETSRLRDKGFEYVVLHSEWNNLEAEQETLKKVILEYRLSWLVVDSYQITADYLAFLNQILPVLYIDDLLSGTYDVSAVLRYSQWPEEMTCQQKYENQETLVLAGMQYVPLREEFSLSFNEGEREKSILITTGGTDTYNVAGRLAAYCMERAEFSEYVFHVIVGSMNSHEKELEVLAKKDTRVQLHKNVSNMSTYMRTCELAVSAGGTTLFELCACKIPTVCFSFADNQQGFTEELEEHQVMLYAGDARDGGTIEERIAERLLILVRDVSFRRRFAGNMARLVDGKGAERIADMICGSRCK